IIGIEPVSKAKVGTLIEHLGNYNSTKDENGKIIHSPAKTADQPPDFELLPAFLEYRRLRYQQNKVFPEIDAKVDARHGGADEADDDGVNANDIAEAMTSHDDEADEEVDPGQPLPARLYIGAQLVSFQIEDKDTKKVQ